MALTDDHLASQWTSAIRRGPVVLALESMYEFVAASVESRGPACWASGRCCNFAKSGHRLYATGLETAYTLARFPHGAPPLTSATLDSALARGGCPFQLANLCGVHAVRPLGCRIYFCDRSAQDWQRDLYERAMTSLRALHDRHAIEYRYGEWREMLAMFVAAPPQSAPAGAGP